MSNNPLNETVGDYVVLDWYDGPLLEIARVDFSDGDRLIQVCSLCTTRPEETPPTERLRGTVHGNYPWTRATVRLTREHLQAMLDLMDGKPVKDFFLKEDSPKMHDDARKE